MKTLDFVATASVALGLTLAISLSANESVESEDAVDLTTNGSTDDAELGEAATSAATSALELREAFAGVLLELAGFALETSDSILAEEIERVGTQWTSKISKYDSDSDNALTLKELGSVPPLDSDDEHFKSLTRQEQQEAIREQFAELDTDSDGKITVEEVKKKMHEARQQIKDAFDTVDLTLFSNDGEASRDQASEESANDDIAEEARDID